jgi:hypothetical protein
MRPLIVLRDGGGTSQASMRFETTLLLLAIAATYRSDQNLYASRQIYKGGASHDAAPRLLLLIYMAITATDEPATHRL